MQDYKKFNIAKEEIVPLAKKMKDQGVVLTMIHGHMNDDGKPSISYDYQIGTGIESYQVDGESVLPSIGSIYDQAAYWPERELMELIDVKFDGCDNSKRLFMPDSMLSGQGQITVTPISEIREKMFTKEEK